MSLLERLQISVENGLGPERMEIVDGISALPEPTDAMSKRIFNLLYLAALIKH